MVKAYTLGLSLRQVVEFLGDVGLMLGDGFFRLGDIGCL